jgi:hypothetical protein
MRGIGGPRCFQRTRDGGHHPLDAPAAGVYAGREAIPKFLRDRLPTWPGQYRLLSLCARGVPAADRRCVTTMRPPSVDYAGLCTRSDGRFLGSR